MKREVDVESYIRLLFFGRCLEKCKHLPYDYANFRLNRKIEN